MPAIQAFMVKTDLAELSDWLNAEADIAQIKPDGPGAWRAHRDFEINSAGQHCLFHTACGPLPLLAAKGSGAPDGEIADPFAGWTENRAGANPASPYFGSGHTAIFWFNVNRSIADGEAGMSSFGWIGDHYSILGRTAPDEAKRFWSALRRKVLKGAVKVNAQGVRTDSRSPYWATPAAMAKLDAGNRL